MLSAAMLLGSSGFSFAEDAVQQGVGGKKPQTQAAEKTVGKQELVRIQGKNRFKTSEEAAKLAKSSTLIVADGNQFADALSAVNVAMSTGGRFILTGKYTDISKIFSPGEINKVYIVGGSVSSYVQDRAKSLDPNTTYLIGQNRYETNQLTLDQFNINSVGVADGRNFPDALSASGLLVAKKIGLKLVDGSRPYGNIKENVVYTFGGKNTVLQDGGKRLFGKNRFLTNLAINTELGPKKAVAVASGLNFPDALSSINAVVPFDASVALANNPEKSMINYFFKDADNVYVFGGLSSISDYTVRDMLYQEGSNIQSQGENATGEFTGTLVNVYDILDQGALNPLLTVNTDDKSKVSIPAGYKIAEEFPSDKNTIYVVKNDAIKLESQEQADGLLADSVSKGMKPLTQKGQKYPAYIMLDTRLKVKFPESFEVYANSIGLSAYADLGGNGPAPGAPTYYMPTIDYYPSGKLYNASDKYNEYKKVIKNADAVVNELGINRNDPTNSKVEKLCKWIHDNYVYGDSFTPNVDYSKSIDYTVKPISDKNALDGEGYAYLTGILFNVAGIEVQTIRDGDLYWNRYKDNGQWKNIDNMDIRRTGLSVARKEAPEFSFEECLSRGDKDSQSGFTNTDSKADEIYSILYKHGYTYLGSELK